MDIIGHDKIINFLDNSIKRNKIAQAYLFSGLEHLGKFTVALEFARKITGSEGQKINPDIIEIRPEVEEKGGIVKKKDIKIFQIRQLQHGLGLSSYGKFKMAIIDDADRLTISAQSALLKTLEEPSENTSIILVCHNEDKILPTVKSRCLIKRFNLVPEAGAGKEIHFWSFGRPGIAEHLEKNETELQEVKKTLEELKTVFESSVNEKFVQAEIMSKDPEKAAQILGLWLAIFREEALGRGVFLKVGKEKSLSIMEKIYQSLAIIKNTNANVKLVLENLFLNF